MSVVDPIEESDILFKLSGGAANADPNLSLGGARSTVSLVDDTANNIWDNVSTTERTSGRTEYRCWYLLNNHSSKPLVNPVIWLYAPTSALGDEIEIALGSSAINGVEQTVANETTAPTGVTFSKPYTFSGGLIIGADILAGQHKAVWEKRIVTAGAPVKPDNFAIIMVRGEVT